MASVVSVVCGVPAPAHAVVRETPPRDFHTPQFVAADDHGPPAGGPARRDESRVTRARQKTNRRRRRRTGRRRRWATRRLPGHVRGAGRGGMTLGGAARRGTRAQSRIRPRRVWFDARVGQRQRWRPAPPKTRFCGFIGLRYPREVLGLRPGRAGRSVSATASLAASAWPHARHRRPREWRRPMRHCFSITGGW